MKKTIILFIFFALGKSTLKAQTYQDTANLIHSYIYNDSTKFISKAFSVLLDSLISRNLEIKEYAKYASNGGYAIDTLYTDKIGLYFAPYYRKLGYYTIAERMQPGFSLHVPTLIIHFDRQVPFLDAWNWNDRQGLGSPIWNEKLALYWGLFKVKSIEFYPE